MTFDDIGALENVKETLKELVMLPLQRPELFCKGQLTKVSFIFLLCRIFVEYALSLLLLMKIFFSPCLLMKLNWYVVTSVSSNNLSSFPLVSVFSPYSFYIDNLFRSCRLMTELNLA